MISPSMTPYQGERYLNLVELYQRYEELARAHPEWITLERVGVTRAGHDLLLLTLSAHRDITGAEVSAETLTARPALWIDAGTHAAEWAGIGAALYDVERWLALLSGAAGTEAERAHERAWFERHVIYVMPLICPDGYDALWSGLPYLRSTLRDERDDIVEVGLKTSDLDGDGAVRWMRWRHPAGPFIEDEVSGLMRGRRLNDDPSMAHFMCLEGSFVCWDGWRWEEAPRPWVEGLDLNRNFPAHWRNFSMFGMDGGAYPLSELESRVVVDAFAARPRIAAALTYHTFTGALLTQPYRKNSTMSAGDIRLMEAIGHQAVEGTGYRVIRVHPDFVYDEDAEVVGVWSDTLSTVFGVPGYTLELWDPFKRNGLENPRPAQFFSDPDPEMLRGLVSGFKSTPGAWRDWTPFDHPQLGPVELGGLDFMMTVRNPPVAELAGELERSHSVAEQMRLTLPCVRAEFHVDEIGVAGGRSDESMREHKSVPLHLFEVTLSLENEGFLSTSALDRGEEWSGCPKVSARLELPESASLISGARVADHDHLAGWGEASLGLGGLSPSLQARGHRARWRWVVRAPRGAQLHAHWSGGRGGAGVVTSELGISSHSAQLTSPLTVAARSTLGSLDPLPQA